MVIIIGAGPIGLACGIELSKQNIPYLIIEKGVLVNSIFHYPTNMTFFSTSERLEMGGVPFISHGTKATRREALEYYRRVKKAYDMPVNVYESVEDVFGEDGNFTVKTDKATYEAEKIIIATGFYGLPHKMNVPGEELPKVRHYFDEPHPYVDQNVLVVGGANSAVDVALETYRSGANVSMVVREPELKSTVKYWVRPDIENRIKEGSISCWFNSTVKEITEDEVVISTPEGEKRLQNDFVLAMTGYEPNFDFLKRLNLEFHDDEAHTPVYDEESLETSRPGVYMAGVVCGGLNTSRFFIENTIVHGEIIAADIQKKRQKLPQPATK